MSVTIRLSRIGRRNLASYKIVVANTRSKRTGKSLDILGHYNPSMNPAQFSFDKDKYQEWISKGALVTDAVAKLVKGDYVLKVTDPHKKKQAEAATKAKEETTATVEDSKQGE